MIVDNWISRKIGLPPEEELTRRALELWQLACLRKTLARVLEGSSFYREKFVVQIDSINKGAYSVLSIDSPDSIAELPFTTPDELAAEGSRMVCVPASSVSRIVTLQGQRGAVQLEPISASLQETSGVPGSCQNAAISTSLQETSGTTGHAKRVWFTESDQELMIDYIHHGLPVMTGPGDVFLVLMPCERPGSVGDLVATGVERIGSRAVRIGGIPPDGSRDEEILSVMRRENVTTGLATAPTAARLASKSASDTYIRNNMKTILLSAQFISDADKDTIESSWGCKCYEHYGMTEMGLGGAMACAERTGYHPREADLLFEIIDPDTGAVLPEGKYGEIVFTTLTREAMPLIRYRTGDFSRWLPGECGCGSILKRLDRVGDRRERKWY